MNARRWTPFFYEYFFADVAIFSSLHPPFLYAAAFRFSSHRRPPFVDRMKKALFCKITRVSIIYRSPLLAMNPRKSKTSTIVADLPSFKACSNPDPRPPSCTVSSRIGEERKPSKYSLDPTRTTPSSWPPVVFSRNTIARVDVGCDGAIPPLPGRNATAELA